MMKRLILGITLSISLVSSQVFADGQTAVVGQQLQYMYQSLEKTTLQEAQVAFKTQMATAKIAVNPGMLAAFAAIHTQIHSQKSIALQDVKDAIAEYKIEDFKGLQSALKSLNGKPFNKVNLGKTSYVAGLAQGRQGVPTARASIAGNQKDEASLVVQGREYKPTSYQEEFSKALAGDTNEARANAVAVALVENSLKTACEGVKEETCSALALKNAEAYLALHVFPLAGKYGAQSLALLNIGINVDGLQSAKTGIPKMSLHGGLSQILKNPKQLSDESSHLGQCGLGKAAELKSYQTAI